MPLPEKALIARVRRLAKTSGAPGAQGLASAISSGIGDDCAVLRLPSSKNAGDDEILVTTDFSLEGIHFRRVWHSPEVVGHRCLTRGLSDVAAMGGTPVAAFLSLALPRTLAQVWIERFAKSLIGLAKRHGVVLAGGDTAESPDGILADIIVVGTVPKGRAILRSGARPGDRIFVSGELGCGVAALVEKMRGRKVRESDYLRHFYPEARLELGRALREQRLASAMIDMSDGLSTDLGHLCEESGVGAEIKADSIPRARVGRPAREVALDLALHGGDDYELLFTVRPGKHVPEKIAGVTVTEIGRITRSRKLGLRDATGFIRKLAPRGWEHFR